MKTQIKKIVAIAALALAFTLRAAVGSPAAVSNSAGSNDVPLPFSLGYVFTVNQSMNVTDLGQFDVLGNGRVSTAKVALFNWDTGTKIAETSLATAVLEETGFYDTHFVSIAPVTLLPGTRYLLATEAAANEFIYGNGIITFASAVQWTEGRATPLGNPAMPATADATSFSIVRTDEASGSYFGPNMKLIPAPVSTPAATSTGVGSSDVPFPFSLGYVFTVSQNMNVTHLGQFDVAGNGVAGAAKVALFNWDSGAKLVETSLASSSLEETGTYDTYFAAIAPVTLSPGTRYLLATEVAANDFIYGNNIISFNGAVQWSEGRATPLNIPAIPATADATSFPIVRTDEASGSYFGPNMKLDILTPSSGVTLTSPTARAIFQRNSSDVGSISLAGTYGGSPDRIEARAVVMPGAGNSGTTTDWQTIANPPSGGVFSGSLSNVPAGGWYQLEVRSVTAEVPGDPAIVQKVGVGDIYVTCGQSNSANYGQGGYTASDDRVCARTSVSGANWILAADPLPIAGGGGGSVWTRLGDMLASAENIPIGFIAVGVGSTQVIEWIPGSLNYNNLLKPAVQSFPSSGFRAVLWHQGESDSLASTTPADYETRLQSIIAQVRTDAGWTMPWYVAEASFHPGSTLAQEAPVVAGQRRVIHDDPLIFAGPATDDFHREGKLFDTVHFNAAGLSDHAQQWMQVLTGTAPLAAKNGNLESNGGLADGGIAVVNMGDVSSPSVIAWHILNATGEAAADGGNGYFNPDALFYANAVDGGAHGGVLPNMNGRHVAFLYAGSDGNHFLQTRRATLQPNTTYALTVALGVRDNGNIFGNARIELLADGVSIASRNITRADLDALNGGNAANTFTDVQLTYASGPTVNAGQPLSIRITKLNGLISGNPTYVDFDNVRLTTLVSDFETWASANQVSGGTNGDDDQDGLNNLDEYAFGLDPKSGSSSNPISVQLDKTTGTFSYTRRLQSLTTLSYSVWYSTDLSVWTEDTGAVEGTISVSGDVETVPVTLSSALLGNTKLFIQVRAQ